jgi:hypothetical protein
MTDFGKVQILRSEPWGINPRALETEGFSAASVFSR